MRWKKAVLAGSGALVALAGLAATSGVQAQHTTLAYGGHAVSYCWKNSSDYYFCYGPTQRTSAGERDVDKALDYSGCDRPDQQQYFSSGSGVCRGAFFICRGTKLYNYHNDEDRIRGYLQGRGC